LADAIEAGLSLIPHGTPGRLLLLTDGKWTGRDPLPVASSALARNIAIDYQLLDRTTAGDLALARIDAPTNVSQREPYLITAWVYAPVPQTISYVLNRDNVALTRKDEQRQLVSGLNRLTFRDRATVVGNQAYSLTVETVPTKGEKAEK